MPESRGRKQKKEKRRQQKRPSLQTKTSWLTQFRLLWSGFCALLFLAAALVVFLPRMTMESSGLFDQNDPYSETFTLTNTGIIPLKKNNHIDRDLFN